MMKAAKGIILKGWEGVKRKVHGMVMFCRHRINSVDQKRSTLTYNSEKRILSQGYWVKIIFTVEILSLRGNESTDSHNLTLP